ncbi:Alt a 1 major allergen, partial [Clathrospora elynae]
LSAAAPLDTRQTTAPCPVTTEGDYVWKISKFWARKLDGKNINSLEFNISATNNGTLDFQCAASAANVDDGKFHSCGENSFIEFAFQGDRSGLLLKQNVSDVIQYVATTTVPNVCRAGGSGIDDLICQGVSDAYITLV